METAKEQFDKEKRKKRLADNLKKKRRKQYRKDMEAHWIHRQNKENE